MTKKLFVLVILLLVSVPIIVSSPNYAFAQSYDTAWVRRYNGPANSYDWAYAIALDGSGNVYVAGSSFGSGTHIDWAIIKYYPNGDTAWLRRYNGQLNSEDDAVAMAIDDSNYVYVTGSSADTSTDCTTIKYYPNGDTVWVRKYNGPANKWDQTSDIRVDGSGNVYVTGFSWPNNFLPDYVTIKYYSNGDTAWLRRYNGPGNSSDQGTAIALDSSGNVYVTGESEGSGTSWDYVTIKYSQNGDSVWVRRYNGPGNLIDWAQAIAIDGSGNIYVTGWSDGGGTSQDYATIKYNPNGDTAWVRRYNGPANGGDSARAISVDGSGNIYVTGYSMGSGTDRDYATIKYFPNGDTAWVKRYNGLGNGADRAFDMVIDDFGNVYVTGSSFNGANYDYLTVIYYTNGNTQELRYDGGYDDFAKHIAIDNTDNVYVTGYSMGSGTGEDYATIKYLKKTDVKDETGDRGKPSEFTLSQNYPNPFNQSTKIEFTLPHTGFVSLNIYDLLGRKLRTLVSENLSSGYKSVTWDGRNDSGKEVASGIYFYKLRVGDYSEAKKLLLLK